MVTQYAQDYFKLASSLDSLANNPREYQFRVWRVYTGSTAAFVRLLWLDEGGAIDALFTSS